MVPFYGIIRFYGSILFGTVKGGYGGDGKGDERPRSDRRTDLRIPSGRGPRMK